MDLRNDLSNIAALICGQRGAELLDELGAGSHKKTFLIRDRGELLALKVAPVTPSLRPRFEREANAMMVCSHRSIARLHSSGAQLISGREHWISVEEYLPGGTLALAYASGGLSPGLIVQVGEQLLSALAHMREQRIVHRDIKPANILFRSADEAVLTDFGIVRVLDAPALTKEFLPVGPATPLYAAPEQLRNEIPLIDWRTDQFCLAVVLAECVMGAHPFAPDGDPNAAVARVAARQGLSQQSTDRLAAAGFGCLARAMAPWPAQRYRAPQDLVTELRGVPK